MPRKYFLWSGLILLLLAAAVGWWMFDLNQRQQLWGHLPLFLFSFTWIGIILLIHRRRNKELPHSRWLALSLISAALLSLGFPPFPTFFTLFVAWVPLFFLEKEIHGNSGVRSPFWLTAFYGYNTFVVWNILTTYWVGNTAFVAGVFAILANSLLMLFPWLLFSAFRKYVGDRTAYFSFVAFWITFEYLHMRWEVTWPWLTLGNSLSGFSWLPQWYTYTGVFGGTLWILVANVFFFGWIQQRQSGYNSIKRIAGIGLWLLVPMVLSVWMFIQYKPKGEELEVVIVQPNFEPHYEKFNIPGYVQAQRFLDLSRSQLTPQTHYLVYPETAFDGINLGRLESSNEIVRVREMLKEFPQTFWVAGLSAHRIFPAFIEGKKNLRTAYQGENTIYWEAYNAAIQTNHALEDVQVYFKSKLVPGPEIFPYKDYITFMRPLIEKLDGTVEGLATQEDRGVFHAGRNKIAPVICYESIFGEYCNGYIQNGAQAIFIMTNDGWWDKTPGHLQHLYFGRLRAIESRRDIARSANSGISCFIDQKGRILQPTAYDVEAAIRGNIHMNDEITFYVQWGDIIGRLAGFVTAFQLLYILFGYIKRRFKVL